MITFPQPPMPRDELSGARGMLIGVALGLIAYGLLALLIVYCRGH